MSRGFPRSYADYNAKESALVRVDPRFSILRNQRVGDCAELDLTLNQPRRGGIS